MSFVRDLWTGFRFARELRSGSTSDIINPASWLLNAFGAAATASGANVSENTAFNVSVVRKCIDLRAMLVAKLPLKVYRKTGRGPEEQRDHALAGLLRGRVSPARTSYKWRYAMQVCFDLGGNAYSRVQRDQYEAIGSIVWTKPSDIRPFYNEETDAVSYQYKSERVRRLPGEILHVANLTTNGVTGRSPIHDLREALGVSLAAEEHSARSFSNGNRRSGVIEADKAKTVQQATEFAQAWMQHYAGARNAGKTPVLGGGFTWKEAGFTNQEAELLGLRRFSVEDVCRVYHIPLLLAGDATSASAWGSAVEKIMRGLVEFTLDPLCSNWEAEMNTTLLTEREQEEGYYIKFNLDALLRGSPKERAEIYQTMRGIAAMDVNQIRDLEEWERYPDAWAGDPRQPLNNQGGGGKPVPQAAGTSGQGDPQP